MHDVQACAIEATVRHGLLWCPTSLPTKHPASKRDDGLLSHAASLEDFSHAQTTAATYLADSSRHRRAHGVRGDAHNPPARRGRTASPTLCMTNQHPQAREYSSRCTAGGP